MSACDGNGPRIGTPQPLDRVVLVHCSASSARQWKPLAEELAAFRNVPFDLWGHGNQGRWHGVGPLSLAQEAMAIHAACPDGPPFHLVGHSYGGGVALKFALNRPERLRSLTLIEPSSFHVLKDAQGTDARLLDEIRAVAETLNRGVICGDYISGIQTFIDYWGGAGSWESLPDDKKVQFGHLAVHIAHHFWSSIEEKTPLAAYTAVDVPTLISVRHAVAAAIARHNPAPYGDAASCSAPHNPRCGPHVADHPPSPSEQARRGARAEEPRQHTPADQCGRQPAYWRAPARVRGGSTGSSARLIFASRVVQKPPVPSEGTVNGRLPAPPPTS